MKNEDSAKVAVDERKEETVVTTTDDLDFVQPNFAIPAVGDWGDLRNINDSTVAPGPPPTSGHTRNLASESGDTASTSNHSTSGNNNAKADLLNNGRSNLHSSKTTRYSSEQFTSSYYDPGASMVHIEEEQTNPRNVNQRRLQQALFDAGTYSSGITAIDVWVMNHRKTALVRPNGAWWRDPNYEPPLHMDRETCMKALQKLEDPDAKGYIKPEILQPGFGIAGQLWGVENSQSSMRGRPKTLMQHEENKERKAMERRKKGIISSFGSYHGASATFHSFFAPSNSRHGERGQSHNDEEQQNYTDVFDDSLIWTNLHYMSMNPHHIAEKRLEVFLEAGIGKVAGIPFHLPDSKGIVLIYAKAEIDDNVLNKEANVNFLMKCAPFIGSALALAVPTIATMVSRHEEKALFEKKIAKISNTCESNDVPSSMKATNNSETKHITPSMVGDEETFISVENRSFLAMKLVELKNKVFDKTAKASPPPSMSNKECLWSFFGSFLSLLFVCYTAEAIEFFNSSDKTYVIPIGPFGAFTTLLYSLTAAPPAQPRNAIYGSMIAGCTSLIMSYIPSSLLSLRVSLATGTSIALMARCGVTHPPGGALAVILAMGDFNWGSLFLYIIADMIVIVMAILINNLNEKRKYPQYWHIFPKFKRL